MGYERIAPLDASLTPSPELASLVEVWVERRGRLEHGGAFGEFIKRLQREWAIETGIIERLYSWDRGVTEILIEQGVDSALIAHQGGLSRDKAEEVSSLIKDQLSVVEGLFSFVKGDVDLTEHFIRSLHAQFTQHQHTTEALTADGKIVQIELLKGQYKQSPNNPRRSDGTMHFYCPPELVKEEMERLLEGYRSAERDSVSCEILSAWLHHRFTQIHPFQDGNGRMARALASIVFLKRRLFPLVIRDSDRVEYIAALETADAGNTQPLCDIFAIRQSKAILKALSAEQEVEQLGYAEQIIASAIEVLKGRKRDVQGKVAQALETAGDLLGIAADRFSTLASSVELQISGLAPVGSAGYKSFSDCGSTKTATDHYFQREISEIAGKFQYRPDYRPFAGWIRLSIQTEDRFELVVSIHGYRSTQVGLFSALALSHRRVRRDEGDGTEPVGTQPACIDHFQFNYADVPDAVVERFRNWLEAAIAMGLESWRRSLGS